MNGAGSTSSSPRAAGLRGLWMRLTGEAVIRRSVRNSGWLLGANGATGLLALAQGVLLTRALGLRQYGVYALVTTFVVVANRLTSFRMNEFVVKFVSDALGADDRALAGAALKVALATEALASALAFVLLLALAPLGADWFVHDPAVAPHIRLYSLTVLGMLVAESSLGTLQVFGRFRQQALLSTLGAVLLFAATGVAWLAGGALIHFLLAAVVASWLSWAIMGGAAVAAARRALGPDWWRVPLSRMGPERRRAVSFGLSTNASSTLSLVTRDADVLWLGLFRGAGEAGLYRLAFTVGSYVMLPIGQLAQAFYPEIAREAAARAWGSLRRLLRRATWLAAGYAVPAALGVGLGGAWILRIAYGAPFAPAAGALAVLLVGMGFANLFFWSRPALLSLGLAAFPLRVNLVLALVKVVGVLLIVPRFGYIGNAALLTALYLAGVSLCVWKVRNEVRERIRRA